MNEEQSDIREILKAFLIKNVDDRNAQPIARAINEISRGMLY